jgi:malate dehydrogenase (oxaloacetate-decarboxylating)(NADP+)
VQDLDDEIFQAEATEGYYALRKRHGLSRGVAL